MNSPCPPIQYEQDLQARPGWHTVFRDADQLSLYDEEHSEYEDHWITLALSQTDSLLVVIHTFQQSDPDNVTIRIISARKAEHDERLQYYSQLE